MHRVRLAVRENVLASPSVCEASYVPAIALPGRGWVAEGDGAIQGFAVGNSETGNIWALFVDPDFEARGIGRRLHQAMVSWLFERGTSRLWLSTEPGTRAQWFYEAAGWTCLGILSGGEVAYELLLRTARDPSVEAAAPGGS